MVSEKSQKSQQAISKRWRWLIVTIYVMSIYAFLPFGTQLWVYILKHYGKNGSYLGIVLIFFLGAYFLYYLIFKKRVRNFYSYLSFLVISLACVALLKYVCLFSAERFHLLMYGALSVMVFWAMKSEVSRKRIYVYTTVIVFITGGVDEVIQYFLPMRSFDVRDIFLNWASGILGILFIIFVLKPGKEIV